MNFSKSDLAHLKWSLLAFTLCLLAGGSAMWLSEQYISSALKDRQAAQRQLIEARNKLSGTQSDLDNMSTYALEYTSLVKNKIMSGEQRLDWIEGLKKLQQERRVIDFNYTIEPQKPFIPTPALDTGNFEISLSGLSLQIDLLHEMQLIDFFKALRFEMKGWFIVDECTLERADTVSSPAQHVGPRLRAACSGGWITLKNRSAP